MSSKLPPLYVCVWCVCVGVCTCKLLSFNLESQEKTYIWACAWEQEEEAETACLNPFLHRKNKKKPVCVCVCVCVCVRSSSEVPRWQ